MTAAPSFFAKCYQVKPVSNPPRPLVMVKYCGLQSGCGVTASRALFNVVAGPVDLLHSTRTVESLEAEGYDVREAQRDNAPLSTSNAQLPQEAA